MAPLPDLLRCALPTTPDPGLAEAVRRPRAFHAAVDALAYARERPSHAVPRMAEWFRSQRWLGSKERPVVAEAVFGVVRHEAILRRAGARTDSELVEGWSRLIAGERFRDLAIEGSVAGYATALSLPEVVAGEWLGRLGPEEAARLAGAISVPAPTVVRANRLKCTRAALIDRLAAEGVAARPWPAPESPDAVVLDGRVSAGALPSWKDGLWEFQDASSQILVEEIDRRFPGAAVLDLCAGAGGKALALAARGHAVRACDVRPDTLHELDRRARRAGALAHAGGADGVTIGPPLASAVVLVDAPCTGTGRLRRDPALRWGFDPDRHILVQRRLLDQAAPLVEPGGVLVWATCSLLAREYEHDLPGWSALSARILWPHREGTDGFAWRILARNP